MNSTRLYNLWTCTFAIFLATVFVVSCPAAPTNNKDTKDARKFFNRFFDDLFVKRNANAAFSNFAFQKCDAIDRKAIGKHNCDGKSRSEWKLQTKLSANAWFIGMGDRYLGIGINQLREDGDPNVANEEFDKLLSEAFTITGTSYDDLDHDGAGPALLKQKIERSNILALTVKRMIEARIDNNLYKKNIESIRKGNKFAGKRVAGRMYYEFALFNMDPTFFFVARRVHGRFKIIHMEDDV